MDTEILVKLIKIARDWAAYNKNLKKRGSLDFLTECEDWSKWVDLYVRKKNVGAHFYSDAIIEACLLIRHHKRLPFRQTQGFIQKIFQDKNLTGVPVPCYTTLCRRAKKLKVDLAGHTDASKAIPIALDSTGLKRRNIGEWLQKRNLQNQQKSDSKRGKNEKKSKQSRGNKKAKQAIDEKNNHHTTRRWTKFHVAIDLDNQRILAFSLTENNVLDHEAGIELIRKIPCRISRCYADGAYDPLSFRSCLDASVKQIIPPRADAVIHDPYAPDFNPAWHQRNVAVRKIKKDGRKKWKQQTGYHQRSKVETTMYRFKVIFGDELRCRTPQTQLTEVAIKCKLLNIYAKMGFG
jgi:hypothetical protein